MSHLTSSLTIRLLDDVSRPARSVAAALRDTQKQVKDVASAMGKLNVTDRFQASLSHLKLSKADLESVSKAWRDYANSARLSANAADWTKGQVASVKAWERQTIASLREVKREQINFDRAQRQAVRRAAEGHAEHGFFGRHGAGGVMAGGAAGYVGAHGVLHGMKEAYKGGADRQHVRVGAMNAGIGPDELRRMETAAIVARAHAPNLSATEILELHKEVRSAVQHSEEAFHLMPDLAKAASILKGSGAQNANLADIVKGGESLGLMNDPKRFHAYLEGQVKAMQVMGKTIDTTQIYEAAKYSKSAGATLSDRFLNLVMPSLIQEMHGSSAGDALSMLTKTFRGGLQHKHLPVERMNQLGLLEDPSKIRRAKKTGQIMGYAGKVKGDSVLASDPQRWFEEFFDPAAEKKGFKTLEDKTKLLSEVLPSTAANLARIFLQQRETLKNHAKLYENAPGLDQSVENQKKDPKADVIALKAALEDLAAAVTGPAMGNISKGISGLADTIRSLSETAEKYPKTAMTAGGALGAGALGAAGWLAYQVSTGFGLPASATALSAAAGSLETAAIALGKGGVPGKVPDVVKGTGSAAAGSAITGGATIGGALTGAAVPAAIGLAAGVVANGAIYLTMRGLKAVGAIDDTKPSAQAGALRARQAAADRMESQGDPRKWKRGGRFSQNPASFPAPEPAYVPHEADMPLPPARPKIDTSSIEAVKPKADAAKTSVDALNTTVTPVVATGGIDTAIAKTNELLRLLSRVGSLSASASGQISSLGKVQRGHFSTAGVQGE